MVFMFSSEQGFSKHKILASAIAMCYNGSRYLWRVCNTSLKWLSRSKLLLLQLSLLSI